MDDGTALLAAIRLFPDEDVPRLAYADWLDEHGDSERAEFIRVQCELERMRKPPQGLDRNAPVGMFGERERKFHKWGKNSPWGRQRAALRKRERFLRDIGTNCPGFLEVPAHWGKPLWKRGFIEALEIPAVDWLAHADTVLAAHPVQEVTLTTALDWCHRDGAVYLYEGWPPPIDQTKGRRSLNVTPASEGIGNVKKRISYIEGVLRAEWPSVKTWHLPPAEPTGLGRFMTSENEYLNGIMRAAEAAGRAAGMWHNEEFLRAFLDG